MCKQPDECIGQGDASGQSCRVEGVTPWPCWRVVHLRMPILKRVMLASLWAPVCVARRLHYANGPRAWIIESLTPARAAEVTAPIRKL